MYASATSMKFIMPFIIIPIFIFFFIFGAEEIIKRFSGTRVHRWWRRYVIGEVDDHYPL